MTAIRPRYVRVLILAAVLAMVAGSSLAKKNAAEPQVHAREMRAAIRDHAIVGVFKRPVFVAPRDDRVKAHLRTDRQLRCRANQRIGLA